MGKYEQEGLTTVFESIVHRLGRRGFMAALSALALTAALSVPTAGLAFADSGTSTSGGGSGAASGTTTLSTGRPHLQSHGWRRRFCARVDWGCVVQGEPKGFDAGDQAGYRIWHNANEDTHWHVETTDGKGVSHEYTGALTTDGKFTNLVNVKPENDDKITQTGDGNITFDLKTYSGIDGLRFSILGGTTLTMNLNIDGQSASTSRIFLGRHHRHPASLPLVFDRHK